MNDVAAIHTLSPASIVFNDGDFPGTSDMFYITSLKGFDFPSIRTPQWNVPQGPGGRRGQFQPGPRHLQIQGEYLVQSTRIEDEIREIRNLMAVVLYQALFAMLPDSPGSWSYTIPVVGGTVAFEYDEVMPELELDSEGIDQKVFTFGLWSPTEPTIIA